MTTNDDTKMEEGLRVKRAIALLTWSQSDLARAADVVPAFVSSVVRGVRGPSEKIIRTLVEAGISEEWLMKGVGEPIIGAGRVEEEGEAKAESLIRNAIEVGALSSARLRAGRQLLLLALRVVSREDASMIERVTGVLEGVLLQRRS